jgi:hypothetical protein
MPSLNEIVYDIKNIAYGGVQSDDNPISDRQIAFWVNYESAVIRGQTINTGNIPDQFIQYLECVELECVDEVECCEVSSTEKILRSTQKLPVTIQRRGKNTIISVSSVDKVTSFSETTEYRRRVNKYNKYTGSKPRWFIKNDYLYVINTKMLEYVTVGGVFEDPTEAANFLNCAGDTCFTWDSKYPITMQMTKIIVDTILNNRMQIVTQSPKDEDNDARGKTTVPVNSQKND